MSNNTNTRRTIKGELKNINYFNPETNWCIVKIQDQKTNKLIPCLGVMNPRILGAIYELTGEAVFNTERKEWQLHFIKCEKLLNMTVDGVVTYLSKEAPGLGLAKAKKLVDRFGDKTLETIEKDVNKILETISDFSLGQAENLQDFVKRQSQISKTKEALYSVGLTPGLIKKIIEYLGNEAHIKLHSDVFELTKVSGIGFLTCCKIADKIGIPPNNPHRVRAGIIYSVQELMNQGNCCVSGHDLIIYSVKILSVNKDVVIKHIKELIEEKKIFTNRDEPIDKSECREVFNFDDYNFDPCYRGLSPEELEEPEELNVTRTGSS